jgi:hypothetical protein
LLASSLRSVRELPVAEAPGGLRGCAAGGEGESWLWLVATLAGWGVVCRAACILQPEFSGTLRWDLGLGRLEMETRVLHPFPGAGE